jgi:hypothetical protein
MKEVPAKEDRPLESWTKLIEKTISGYPLTQAITSATQKWQGRSLDHCDKSALGGQSFANRSC